MPTRATRFFTLPEYPLATIPQKKRELVARGVDVIDLGAGDADLAPPQAALDRMRDAVLEPPLSRYGFGLGHVPYREAVSAWMQRRFGVRCDPLTEVVPLLGSKEGISHLAFAYLEPGCVSIIPEPGYNPYQGGTLLSSGEPYRYPLRPRTEFLLDVDEIPREARRSSSVSRSVKCPSSMMRAVRSSAGENVSRSAPMTLRLNSPSSPNSVNLRSNKRFS